MGFERFRNTVQIRLGGRPSDAEAAIRATLNALAARLPKRERRLLAARLPHEVACELLDPESPSVPLSNVGGPNLRGKDPARIVMQSVLELLETSDRQRVWERLPKGWRALA